MKRKIIANTALTLILASSFMTGVKATETSNQVLKVETEYKELPSSIGENILTKILKQQENDFEVKDPLSNKKASKLDENNETFLLYKAMTEIEGKPLTDFSYKISNVKVYKNDENQIFIDGYIVRDLTFGDIQSGFGDDIKLQVNKKNDKSFESVSLQVEDVEVLSDSSIAKNTTLDQFINRYKKEKIKSQAQAQTDKKVDFSLSAITYNRTNAVKYALKYAEDQNPYYPYFATQGDCTNFVSQALNAGGIPQNGSWFMKKNSSGVWAYSPEWVNAGSFRDYIREEGGILMKTVPDEYGNASLGDVYHYDTRNDFFLKYPDGEMEHTAIVTKKVSPTIYVSYHSTNRKDVPSYYYTSVEGGDRFLSHISDSQ